MNILLSFDVEEFDFTRGLGEEEQYRISYDGLVEIKEILNKYNIKATFFVTALFAEKYFRIIKELAKEHEIGLHAYSHSDDYNKEGYEKLKKGKEIIEKIINKEIVGFRAPKMRIVNKDILKKLELIYDSSLNPTWILGEYNHFFKKRKLHFNEIYYIPVSVFPLIRLPMFWIASRNLGLWYIKLGTLLNKDYINLIFHPWEFIDISKVDIPYNLSKLVKRNTGKKMKMLLENYIKWCLKKNYKFRTIEWHIRNNTKKKTG